MIESRQDLVLALEGFDEKKLVRGVAVQPLESALLACRAVEDTIDDPHAARSQFLFDHVPVGHAFGARRGRLRCGRSRR
jgi:hypothetical protein